MGKIVATSPSLPPLQDYIALLQQIWRNKWISNSGPLHEQLRAQLQTEFQNPNVSLFTNGHSALETVLKAMDLKGEIITTPFTFVSTTHAIVNAGCTPVFCDVHEEDGTINTKLIESHITENTCAILAVHLYGYSCDVEKIEAIAKKHQLKVIYDAAHAFGVALNDKSIATYGDATMFSFHATKVFHTVEGGAVVCKDPALFEKIELLKNFGLVEGVEAKYIGANYKMSEFHAAMGLCNLKDFPVQLAKRQALASLYEEKLKDSVFIKYFTKVQQATPNYAYFPIRVQASLRDNLFKTLTAHHIYARKYFYPLVTNMPAYKHFDHASTPIAQQLAEEVLVLPLHVHLSIEDVNTICQVIAQWETQLKATV